MPPLAHNDEEVIRIATRHEHAAARIVRGLLHTASFVGMTVRCRVLLTAMLDATMSLRTELIGDTTSPSLQ